MKIKMNNAVGPQVRTAKPKPSKLLPVLGAASMVGGLQAATQFFRIRSPITRPSAPTWATCTRPGRSCTGRTKWVQPVPGRDHEGRQHGMLVSTVGLLGVAVAKVVVQQLEGERVPARLGPLGRRKVYSGCRPAARERNVLEIVTGKAAPTATGIIRGRLAGQGRQFLLPAAQRPRAHC